MADERNDDVAENTRGVFRVQPLWRAFYVAARAADVGDKPLSVQIWGKRFVLYRDATGRAVALLDRCPHRNVPLSDGRVTSAGHLQCRYHGWCFDSSGQCVTIPGRTQLDVIGYRVEGYQVREDGDFVWLCPSELGPLPTGPLSEPFVPPQRHAPGYTTVIRQVSAPASLYAVIENALDVPHTAVLHQGLFRGGKKNRIQVTVEHFHDRVEANYEGEPPPKGLLSRLLSLGSKAGGALTVQHADRFFLPSVLQVEYRLGDGVHFVITGLCTPASDHETRLFAVASFRTPLPGALLALVLEPVARLVFAQDARLLRTQTENTARFGGEQFISTELDALGPGLWRLIRKAAQAEADGQSLIGVSSPTRRDEFELDA